jgi:hypothetical protein
MPAFLVLFAEATPAVEWMTVIKEIAHYVHPIELLLGV